MISNALVYLLQHGVDSALLPAAIEESLRLEPAASVVDRYATEDIVLGAAPIAKGDLVRVSIAAANRDPEIFSEPDRFDPARSNVRRHLAFAHGPHVCLGIHLARLETRIALQTLLERLANLRLDPERPPQVRGLVFRKPLALHALWG
jgi:cytochrome P450